MMRSRVMGVIRSRAMETPTVRDDLVPIAAADPLRVLDYLVGQGDDLDTLAGTAALSRDDRPLVEYLSARALDRTLSWMQNFEALVRIRRHRPDLPAGASAEALGLQPAPNSSW